MPEVIDVLPPPIPPIVEGEGDTDELLPPVYGQPSHASAYTSRPAPVEIEAMKAFFAGERAMLLVRLANIEKMIGFVESSDDMAVRIAKIELFLGLNK